MKIFTNRNFIQKLIMAIVCITLLSFCTAPKVQASLGGEMLGLLTPFVTFMADSIGTLVQYGMTGKWIPATDLAGTGTSVGDTKGYFVGEGKLEYPILQISPELIFANKIEFLDANFITSPESEEEEGKYLLTSDNGKTLQKLRSIIAGWYVTLRTISIVGLLSVLIYIGIRIIISSTSADKAKYKQRLVDWIVAFCLLFFMHYIMAATVTIVDKVNILLADIVKVDKGLEIDPDYGRVTYTATPTENHISVNYQLIKNWLNNNGYIVDNVEEQRNGLNARIEFTLSKEGEQFPTPETLVLKLEDSILRIDSYDDSVISQEDIGTIRDIVNHINDSIDRPEISGGGEEPTTVPHPRGYSIYVSSDATDATNGGTRVLYFTNYARLFLNAKSTDENRTTQIAYLIIYVALIVFTVVFAFRYIKRVIYIAFLTLIAPTVALTYPIDKIKDRKSTSMEYVV